MTDHFELATSLMVTAGIVQDAIDDQYRIPGRKTAAVLMEITRLKADHKNVMEMARLHVGMADVQATHDLRAEVERLFQALTAEPVSPPPPPRMPTPLELVDGVRS